MKKFKTLLICFSLLICSSSVFAMEKTQEEKNLISNEEESKQMPNEEELKEILNNSNLKYIEEYFTKNGFIKNNYLTYIVRDQKTIKTEKITFKNFILKIIEEVFLNKEKNLDVNIEKTLVTKENNKLECYDFSFTYFKNLKELILNIEPFLYDNYFIRDQLKNKKRKNSLKNYSNFNELIDVKAPSNKILNKIGYEENKTIEMFDEKKEKVIEFNKEEFLKFLENKIKKYFQIMSINEISGSDFETLTIKNIIDKKTDKCFNLDLKIYRTKYYRGDEIINLQPEYVEVSNFYYNHESNKKYEKLKKDKTSKLKKTNIFEKTNKNPEKIKSIVILNQDSFIGHLNKTEGLRICDDNYSKTKTCFIKDNEKIKGLNFENIMLKKLQKSLNKNKDFKDNYDITIKNIMGTDDNLNDFTCDLTITLFKNKDEDIKDIKKIKEILKQIIKYEKNNKLKNSEKDDFVKQYINLKKEIEKFLGKELTEDTLKNDKSVDLFLKQLFKNIRYYLKNPQTNKFQTKIENKKYIDLLNKPISIDEQNYLQGFKTDSLDIIYLDKNNFKTIHELKNENKNNETGETTPFEILEFSSEEKKLSNELLKAVRENFQLFLKEEFSFFEEKSKTYTVNLNNSNYQINFKTEKIKDVNMLNNILKLNYTILNNIFKLSIKINRLNNNNISFDEKYLNNRLIIPKVFLTDKHIEKLKDLANKKSFSEEAYHRRIEQEKNKIENSLTEKIKQLNLNPLETTEEELQKELNEKLDISKNILNDNKKEMEDFWFNQNRIREIKNCLEPKKIEIEEISLFEKNYKIIAYILYDIKGITIEKFFIEPIEKTKTNPYNKFVNNIAKDLLSRKEKINEEKKEEEKEDEISTSKSKQKK